MEHIERKCMPRLLAKVPRGAIETSREVIVAEANQPSILVEALPFPEAGGTEFVINDVYLINSDNMKFPEG